MKYRSIQLVIVLGLLATCIFAQQRSFAQPSAQGQGHAVFLPLLIGGASVPPPPTPVPTPVPPPAASGFFALTNFLTYNAVTAVDAQGGVHMAFYTSDERHQDDPRGQPAYYVYCAGPVAACADPSHWSNLVQMDDQANEVQIVVTPEGQPRLLVRRNGSTGYDYDYWACDTQCSDAQRWSGLQVTTAAGVDLNSAVAPQHSFALDSQARPRFVYSNGWGNGRPTAIYYAFCDAADCTEPGSWGETTIHGPIEYKTVTADYATLVFAGDQPRVLTRVNYSGLPVRLDYFACEQACHTPESWNATTLNYPADQQWASWDLALDAAGNPRVALYEPAGIDITVGGKLYYGWCDSNCTAADAPFQVVQVASGEGNNVDLAIDAQGRAHMVYDAGMRGTIGELWCDAGCVSAGAWQRRILETSDQLMQEYAPASPLFCDQQVRAWLDAIPTIAFDSQGRMVVAYDTKNVATCYYDQGPGNPPGSRVERLWWAVRWATFARA
jgi:hypothetical protein